jgi:hypothetical protein
MCVAAVENSMEQSHSWIECESNYDLLEKKTIRIRSVWVQLKTDETDNYVGKHGSRAARNLLEQTIAWV